MLSWSLLNSQRHGMRTSEITPPERTRIAVCSKMRLPFSHPKPPNPASRVVLSWCVSLDAENSGSQLFPWQLRNDLAVIMACGNSLEATLLYPSRGAGNCERKAKGSV